MTTLLLARHGETDWNREFRIQGSSDVELNELGRQQAQFLAQELTDVDLAANHPGEQVLIVSHGAALNSLWHHALGVRVERWANCAVYKLAVRDDGFVEID